MSNPSTKTTWFPSQEHLAAYAAGQLDRGQRVLLEAHMALCPSTAKAVGEMLTAGAHYLQQWPEETPPAGVLDRLRRRLDEEIHQATPLEEIPLPEAARSELPHPSQPLRWRPVKGCSAESARLDLGVESRTELLLVRMPGGETFPRHLHLGSEELVVLAGGYHDEVGHFDVGDYYRHLPGTQHQPRVDPGETCWIVTRVEEGLRFLED